MRLCWWGSSAAGFNNRVPLFQHPHAFYFVLAYAPRFSSVRLRLPFISYYFVIWSLDLPFILSPFSVSRSIPVGSFFVNTHILLVRLLSS
jgi:hypothetical protein